MKILIFGSVASGKTTLARKLSKELKIPCYEGDSIAWGFPGEERYKRSLKEQADIIEAINKNDSWIIEGTYRESQKILYDYADKILFLDTPLAIRKRRIVFRYMTQSIQRKTDMDQSTGSVKNILFNTGRGKIEWQK